MTTNPDEVGAGLLVLGLVVLAWVAMGWGWRRRTRSQSRLAEPRWVHGVVAGVDHVECGYVGTTTAGDWLDRITAHGLGLRGPATLARDGADLLVLRPGAGSFAISRDDLLGVRREAGIANRLAPRHLGVVVVTWYLGDRRLDTGFQPRDTAGREHIEQLVRRLDQEVAR